MMRPTVAPPSVLIALALSLSVATGCAAVRDFLIPPPEGGSAAVHRRAKAAEAHLLLHDVTLSDGRRSSVAIRSGRILAVGPRDAISKRRSETTEVLEGRGQVLTPGLVDGHVHLEGWALLGDALDLREIRSLPALLARVRSSESLVSAGGWLWGFGLRPELASLLSADLLHKAVPGLPVWLSAADGHSAVLSQALVARLPAALAKGAKSGHLSEVEARRAWFALPPPAGERLKAFVVQVLGGLAKRGVTTVHVMGARPELQTTLEELDVAGRLRVRCRLYLAWPALATAGWLRRKIASRVPRARSSQPLLGEAAAPARDTATRLVDVLGIKVWLDGTLGARSASLSQPYADRPAGSAPQPQMSAAELRQVIHDADLAGVQVAVHIIGDAALDRLLEALQGLQRQTTAWPVRIEHSQTVRPDQLKQLAARNDLICGVQPLHRQSDSASSADRLGPARATWGYRAASLDGVCPLLAGSDAPVGSVAPWAAMRALTSHDRPAERLSPAAALAAHMRDPRTGKTRGVAVGGLADLVLWASPPVAGAVTQPAVDTVILGGALLRRLP